MLNQSLENNDIKLPTTKILNLDALSTSQQKIKIFNFLGNQSQIDSVQNQQNEFNNHLKNHLYSRAKRLLLEKGIIDSENWGSSKQ